MKDWTLTLIYPDKVLTTKHVNRQAVRKAYRRRIARYSEPIMTVVSEVDLAGPSRPRVTVTPHANSRTTLHSGLLPNGLPHL